MLNKSFFSTCSAKYPTKCVKTCGFLCDFWKAIKVFDHYKICILQVTFKIGTYITYTFKIKTYNYKYFMGPKGVMRQITVIRDSSSLIHNTVICMCHLIELLNFPISWMSTFSYKNVAQPFCLVSAYFWQLASSKVNITFRRKKF